MSMLRWSGLMGVLLLSACSGAPPASSPAQTAPSAVNAWLPGALAAAPALGYEDLVAALGPPVREDATPAGDAASSTLRTLIYHGMELTLQEGAGPARLHHLALTDPRFTAPEGLRVGYAEEQVLRTLGPPARRQPARLLYDKNQPQPCLLVIFLEGGAIARIEWRFGEE